jgi:hypothetical protein
MAVHIVRQLPQVTARCPKDSGEDPVIFQADTEKTDKVLEMKYRTKEETFLDTARRILELEKELTR